MLNGVPFGMIVAALASITLIMAVNTAFVASSELMERVADRYGFAWLIATNRRQSLYRIHVINAASFSIIIIITGGSQMILADMYAIGILACFTINVGSLILYRYFMGTKEVIRLLYESLRNTCIVFHLFELLLFPGLAQTSRYRAVGDCHRIGTCRGTGGSVDTCSGDKSGSRDRHSHGLDPVSC